MVKSFLACALTATICIAFVVAIPYLIVRLQPYLVVRLQPYLVVRLQPYLAVRLQESSCMMANPGSSDADRPMAVSEDQFA